MSSADLGCVVAMLVASLGAVAGGGEMEETEDEMSGDGMVLLAGGGVMKPYDVFVTTLPAVDFGDVLLALVTCPASIDELLPVCFSPSATGRLESARM